MAEYNEKEMSERYEKFIEELEKISTKYGVALDCTGGVWVSPTKENVTNITYDCDHTSGDLRSYVEYKDEN